MKTGANRGLPSRWNAIQSPLTSCGRETPWMASSCIFSCGRLLRRRVRVRSCRFRYGLRGLSGVWLHILTPVQTTTLIAGYGLLTQGYGVWKLRHSLTWKNIAPFVVGGFVGVPLGTMLLTYVNPTYLRGGGGVLLIVYGIYGLVQPKFKPVPKQLTGRCWHRIRQRNCRWPDWAEYHSFPLQPELDVPRFENGPIDVNETVVDSAIKTWRESKAHPGTGNEAFFDLAISLRRAGMPYHQIEQTLRAESQSGRTPKERLDQIRSIMQSLRMSASAF